MLFTISSPPGGPTPTTLTYSLLLSAVLRLLITTFISRSNKHAQTQPGLAILSSLPDISLLPFLVAVVTNTSTVFSVSHTILLTNASFIRVIYLIYLQCQK